MRRAVVATVGEAGLDVHERTRFVELHIDPLTNGAQVLRVNRDALPADLRPGELVELVFVRPNAKRKGVH